MVKIRKKDNSLEDFDREKLRRSVLAAGLSKENANDVTNQIETWVQQSEDVVSTAQIRSKVINFMESKNPEAAKNYKSYKK
ncbi:MAG: ATP cone domain-containing protein [Patescibacteria group bacterium]|nr:ATP cone domain-containing protein [Patescibacteria group bacterium]